MKATKVMAIGTVVFGASLGSAAVADRVDNPGDARFFDATGS